MDMMQMIQWIRGAQDPGGQVMRMLESSLQGNPMGENLLNLAKTGDSAGIEKFARNYMQSQGKDFDKEFASFKKLLGL